MNDIERHIGERTAEIDEKLQDVLAEELGPAAASLFLLPRDGSSPSKLPFDWPAAKAYYAAYCSRDAGNDCPDGSFPLDCTHFVAHGLSRSKIIVNLPSATCTNGVAIRVTELAAAFKNSIGKYTNVKRIDDLSASREGDFCFVVSWFGLATDHAMVLAGAISNAGGKVYGHTNERCGEFVDLKGQDFVVYRIE